MNWATVMDDLERRGVLRWNSWLFVVVVALTGGCETPSAHTISRNYASREDLLVDPPRERGQSEDDRDNGGRLFALYCGSCHNARPLGERPFSNYHVALTHMRDQAYLTGKEYRQIMYFLRRWNDVGPPTPPVEQSPKRFVFSQPLSDLRGETSAADSAAPPPPPGPSPWKQVSPAGAPPTQQPASGLPAPIE
ncbi:MAG: hypothetical protein ACHRXM_09405 [Isosphaerales bacterium]